MAHVEAISWSASTVSRRWVAVPNGRMPSAVVTRGGGVATVPCACVGLQSAVVVGARNELMGTVIVWEVGRKTPFVETDHGRRRGRGGMVVVARMSGGARPSGGASNYRPPRPSSGPRRSPVQQQEVNDGPLMNNDIRCPLVRLLDEDQNMLGVVPTSEALQKSRTAELDLVMISPDAEPPVVRIMDYSKYRYEQQKKKREAQKKAAASRQELKELKMRYNIDTHDYAVRQRAAQRFLKDGDKVKVVCQFKGREMDFKDLAVKLFERFHEEIGEVAILETKISMEGRTMYMVLAPNKAVLIKAQAAAQSLASKSKTQTGDKVEATAAVETPNETEEQSIEQAPASVG